jgi:transposase-like protein
MKNLLDPKLLAKFQERPIPVKEIVDFLDTHPDIGTANLCRIIDISPSKIYNYRGNLSRKSNTIEENNEMIEPKSSSKSSSRYNAEEKFTLLENYLKADDQGKAHLLRKYGLYDSDIKRWREQVKCASLEVLGKRKQRSDKKSEDQIEIERLQQELQEQEKTTAKLSTLLVLQKKTFDMLKKKD